MTDSYVWYYSFMCVWCMLCLVDTCDVAHAMSRTRALSQNMCDMTHSNVWYHSFTCLTCLIHMCDITPSHVWHDLCDMTLIHMCDMTYSYLWHNSFIRVTWLIYVCQMTRRSCYSAFHLPHAYVWRDSSICTTMTRLIHMYDMTHSYVWHDSLHSAVFL